MKYKLKTTDYPVNYKLIALRTEIVDYRLAYLLNKLHFFCFKRKEKDIHCIVNSYKIFFSTFEDQHMDSKRSCFLIKNKAIYENSFINPGSLFNSNLISETVFLIPELKNFDYFLKLVGVWKNEETKLLKKNITEILNLEAEYSINTEKISSINNLFF